MAPLKWYEDPKVFRETRKKLGLTQERLAKKSGVDRTVIANIESGRRGLTGDVAHLLWDVVTRMSVVRRRELLTPAQKAAERAKLKLSRGEYEEFSRNLIEDLKKRDEELEQKYQLHLAKRQGQLEALECATSLDDPIVKEVIETFRREIADLNEQLKEKERTGYFDAGRIAKWSDLYGKLGQLR
jgi:transcriptional regulator with XRE-family HTH domain